MKRDDEIVNAAYNAGQEKYFSELVHRQKKVNSAYGIGFIEGAQWADENPNWIPVTKELPKSNEEVLVCVAKGKGVTMCVAWYYAEKNIWCDYGVISGVTHWMKLPDVPNLQ